jgi:SNF2 family DNA or RNA helicase
MGLGKTIQMLAVMARDQAKDAKKRQMTLVVAWVRSRFG